jgi:hypothetical protein
MKFKQWQNSIAETNNRGKGTVMERFSFEQSGDHARFHGKGPPLAREQLSELTGRIGFDPACAARRFFRVAERSSPSRVRCAAPKAGAPLTAPGRSAEQVPRRAAPAGSKPPGI